MTFISSVFGMNFKYMPELEWRFGYPFAIALMVTVAVGMYWYFRRKRWV
jgi:magnesium transporter